ncbi:MAG: type IV conjugative transfer system protein TraE [Alphaproteobacteria bacterium]|nr:type IV conjugative transfer system protein TraE [Alphaproteobacteria bacterium]
MRLLLTVARLQRLIHQRNLFVGISSVLLMANLLLAFKNFFYKERVVIVPPELHQSFWVEGNRVSNHYLEEMALFFAHLLLDTSEASAPFNRDVILRYAKPDSYGLLKAQLLEEEGRYKKEQLSTSFRPSVVSVDNKRMTAEITGDLLSYVGSKKISQNRETYRFDFHYDRGRLLIHSFTLLKTEAKDA